MIERGSGTKSDGTFGDKRMRLGRYNDNRNGETYNSVGEMFMSAKFFAPKGYLDNESLNKIRLNIEESEKSRVLSKDFNDRKAMIAAIEKVELGYTYRAFDKSGKDISSEIKENNKSLNSIIDNSRYRLSISKILRSQHLLSIFIHHLKIVLTLINLDKKCLDILKMSIKICLIQSIWRL